MLYDPKWEVKADPLSLGSLIKWLEKMPADGKYVALPESTCLLGQFASAMGCDCPTRTSIGLGRTNPFDKIAYWNLEDDDCTFGAALKRARAANTSAR